MIRTANAFGAEIICVGRKKYSAGGAVAGTRHTKIHRFYRLAEAIEYCRSFGCEIAGVEISDESKSIYEQPFGGPAAFMVGNEGEGLSEKQIKLCDYLIRIPQYGDAVSLNVNVAAAVVLSQYAHWAKFPEVEITGNQYRSGKWDEHSGRWVD